MNFVKSLNKENIEIINLNYVQKFTFSEESKIIHFFFGSGGSTVWTYKNMDQLKYDYNIILNSLRIL